MPAFVFLRAPQGALDAPLAFGVMGCKLIQGSEGSHILRPDKAVLCDSQYLQPRPQLVRWRQALARVEHLPLESWVANFDKVDWPTLAKYLKVCGPELVSKRTFWLDNQHRPVHLLVRLRQVGAAQSGAKFLRGQLIILLILIICNQFVFNEAFTLVA